MLRKQLLHRVGFLSAMAGVSSVERQREKLGYIHISSATTEIIGYEGDNGGSQLYNTIGKKNN